MTSPTNDISNPTPAQEEFQAFLDKNTDSDSPRVHPEDWNSSLGDNSENSEDEEDRYRQGQIDAAMTTTTQSAGGVGTDFNLPPSSFDSGRATGVKGVIADARAYEQARRHNWRHKVRNARRSVMGMSEMMKKRPLASQSHSADESEEDDPDEQSFLEQWRESRRMELEKEATAKASMRNRKTSPSMRVYGRLDTVDALGYLDAIEKVGRDTTVVVFVYDHECDVSGLIELALKPLVMANPFIHFVKVHYEDIEFDPAAVPTILAYRNQGDLFANLTGIIDMIPEDEDFDSDSLKMVLNKHDVL